jgi:hypothetical protein
MEKGICEDHTVQIYIKEMYGIIKNRMVQPDTGRSKEEGVFKTSVGKFVRR